MGLGVIGLGTVGTNMVQRLRNVGHQCVVYGIHSVSVQTLSNVDFVEETSIEDFVCNLSKPRAIWMMAPAADVDATLSVVIPHLDREDVVIVGGGARCVDADNRAVELKDKGVHYVEIGTSLTGCNRESVNSVNNGNTHGLTAAYSQGMTLLHNPTTGTQTRYASAETAQRRDSEHGEYEVNLADIAEVWRRGSVVSTWLLDMAASALRDSPGLDKFAVRVSNSDEGRWTVVAAIDELIHAPVLTAALYERFGPRGEAGFADKVLSALSYKFEGHEEESAANGDTS